MSPFNLSAPHFVITHGPSLRNGKSSRRRRAGIGLGVLFPWHGDRLRLGRREVNRQRHKSGNPPLRLAGRPGNREQGTGRRNVARWDASGQTVCRPGGARLRSSHGARARGTRRDANLLFSFLVSAPAGRMNGVQSPRAGLQQKTILWGCGHPLSTGSRHVARNQCGPPGRKGSAMPEKGTAPVSIKPETGAAPFSSVPRFRLTIV